MVFKKWYSKNGIQKMVFKLILTRINMSKFKKWYSN